MRQALTALNIRRAGRVALEPSKSAEVGLAH